MAHFLSVVTKKVFAYYNNVSRHVHKSWPPQHSLWPLLGENPGYASEIQQCFCGPLTFSVQQILTTFRFLPPESICPERRRQKWRFRESTRRVLQQWLDDHRADPYPSTKTKEYLSKKANITPEQV